MLYGYTFSNHSSVLVLPEKLFVKWDYIFKGTTFEIAFSNDTMDGVHDVPGS